jgi:Asp-tRNA(Asn)/Glu-tRNA(Gln) amidotransferase A subunit family amidase
MHLAERLDVVGPMARSVGDCAALMAVLAEPGAAARACTRVATLSSSRQVPTDPAVDAAVRLAGELLRGLGLRVEEQQAEIDHGRIRLAGFI